MASKNPFVGRRYVNLLRCSTHYAETSPDAQKEANDRHAAKLGMICVGDVELRGVSGSKTFNRKDLIDLAHRRQTLKNYDVIVVYDSSRLTRGGARHSFAIKHAFAKLGVAIISVMDPVPEGDFKDVIEALIATQNASYAKKTAGFVTRGIRHAVCHGIVERHGNVPIGVDRLYYDIDGNPKLRLRMLSAGRRQLIDETNGKVLREIKREEGGTAAYLLQGGEKSKLALGAELVVDGIREAFRLRYRDGYGYTRIARRLAELGVYPTRTTFWSETSVRGILLNPMYLGWSYAFQTKCGLHFCTSKDGPLDREIDQAQLEEQGRADVPTERRAVEEMYRVEHAGLASFIVDDDVRAAAEKTIREYYIDWHLPKNRYKLVNTNSQPNSRYFLRGLLRSKQHKTTFAGWTHGRDNAIRDYHCATKIDPTPPTRHRFTTIRAEPIEKAVIRLIEAAFEDVENLKAKIDLGVQRALSELPSEVERQQLEKELAETKARFLQIQRSFTTEELKNSDDVISDLRRRRLELEARIASAASKMSLNAADLSRDVLASLRAIDENLDAECYEKLRLLVKTICPLLLVDLETLEVEMQVRLPPHMLRCKSLEQAMMGGPCNGFESNAGITPRDSTVEIAVFHLRPMIVGPSTRKNGYPRYLSYESVNAASTLLKLAA